MNDYPRITVHHRYGHVFLRMIRKSRLGIVSDMAKLDPEVADAIADELRSAASGARKDPKLKKLKLVR